MFRRLLLMTILVPALAYSQDFLVGINGSIKDGDSAVSSAANLGVSSLRFDVPWREIEKSKGNFAMPQWIDKTVSDALTLGMQPLLILSYGNPIYGIDKPRTSDQIDAFKRYVLYVVRYFAGRVTYYELWNEWNTTTGSAQAGTPEDYVHLESVIFPAVRSVQPTVKMLAAASSGKGLKDGWMDKFFSLKGASFCSGVSIHPYAWYDPAMRTPEASLRLIDKIETSAKKWSGGSDVPLYITEIGWPSYDGDKTTSQDDVAQYLMRFYLLASTRSYIEGVWWYALKDLTPVSGNPEGHFGVFDSLFEGKPSATALQQTANLLKSKRAQTATAEQLNEITIQVWAPGASHSQIVSWTEYESVPGANTKAFSALFKKRPLAPALLHSTR